GMGEVFQARRADGRYAGLAAVKLLRVGRGGEEILRRFSSEQQALARLNHPHIARLLDAGQTQDATPYFVMELVEGKTIDVACAELNLHERLRLFEQLLSAVAHAHTRLLIHRDLKPSNVMVDAQGHIKLLDFGIAKALDPLEESDINTTIFEQRPFTPAYSSPEQVKGEPVTTATDIYSLGVLLYTLLTGEKPYGRSATTPAQAAQAVLNEAPSTPSSASMSSSIPARITAANFHAIESTLLQGDLDNIILKALKKNPDERYRSVDAFAADIRAFLHGYPVSARAATRWYLIKKWVNRHRLGVALSGSALGLIIATSGFAVWQAIKAEQARQQAQTNLTHLKSITRGVLYRVGNQISDLAGGIEIRAKMTQALIEDLEKLANVPDADPTLQEDLAQAWARLAVMQADNQNRSLNQNDLAIKSAQRAIYWFEKISTTQNIAPSFAEAWSESWRSISNAYRADGKIEEALAAQGKRYQILAEAIKRWPKSDDLLHAIASTHLNRGQLLAREPAQFDQAKTELLSAQTRFQELVAMNVKDSSSHHQLGVSFGALAVLEESAGHYAESYQAELLAIAALQQAVQLKPKNIAHQSALGTETMGACILGSLNESAPIIEACQAGWAINSNLLVLEPNNTSWRTRRAQGAIFVARSLAKQAKVSEALAILDEGIAALSQYGKSPKELTRLAWTQVERAMLLGAKKGKSDLVASQLLLAEKMPDEKDRAAWLLRARWFQVAGAENPDKQNGQAQLHIAIDAYHHADKLIALAPQHRRFLSETEGMLR
ncbi:MAG: serine/threonine protein kinase, partial [Undibacterium sp.]|nr:serine/threonine protein kinase [Undibacterium sp.]